MCCAAQWMGRGRRASAVLTINSRRISIFHQRGHADRRRTKPWEEADGHLDPALSRSIRACFGAECRQRFRHPCPCRGAHHPVARRRCRRDDDRQGKKFCSGRGRRRHQLLPAAQPRAFRRRTGGTIPRLLYRSGMVLSPPRRSSTAQPIFASAAVPIDPWLHRAAVMLYEELSDGEIDELGLYEVERLIDSLADAADSSARAGTRSAGNDGIDFRVLQGHRADEGQCLRAHLLRRRGEERRPVAAAFLRAVQGADQPDAQRLLEHAAHAGGAAAAAMVAASR